LSLVEQGRSDITIGRLLRLAEFYDLELSDLLNDGVDAEIKPVHVLRADPDRMIHSDVEGVDLFDLTGGTRWTLLPGLAVHQPSSNIEISHADDHETILFVLEGTFELEIAGCKPVRLRRGEGVIHRNIASYRVRNVSRGIGRMLGISLRRHPSHPVER
jgi:transcriptional regulator with XRE-family HTH domain